jgi:deoxycytidylate deaminase
MDAPPREAIQVAVTAAQLASCGKSQRGVAVFGNQTGSVIAGGYNHPPGTERCNNNATCRAVCRFRCVHAEVMAIRHALVNLARLNSSLTRDQFRLVGHDALHVKVGAGVLVPSGPPSCLSCAREVLDIGLEGFWLYREIDGERHWVRYPADTFFLESQENDRDVMAVRP